MAKTTTVTAKLTMVSPTKPVVENVVREQLPVKMASGADVPVLAPKMKNATEKMTIVTAKSTNHSSKTAEQLVDKEPKRARTVLGVNAPRPRLETKSVMAKTTTVTVKSTTVMETFAPQVCSAKTVSVSPNVSVVSALKVFNVSTEFAKGSTPVKTSSALQAPAAPVVNVSISASSPAVLETKSVKKASASKITVTQKVAPTAKNVSTQNVKKTHVPASIVLPISSVAKEPVSTPALTSPVRVQSVVSMGNVSPIPQPPDLAKMSPVTVAKSVTTVNAKVHLAVA